jgi:hypothetical protein
VIGGGRKNKNRAGETERKKFVDQGIIDLKKLSTQAKNLKKYSYKFKKPSPPPPPPPPITFLMVRPLVLSIFASLFRVS